MNTDRPGLALHTKICGRYELLKKIGKGGVGHVYEAFDKSAKTKVALKVLVDGIGAEKAIQDHFLEACQAGIMVSHANVVRINYAGRFDNGVFCVMELLEGKSLKEVLLAKKILLWQEAVPVFLQACDALSAVHAKGLVHGNMKPSKIFLAGSRVKLLDFSLSLINGEGIRKDGGMIGTPQYFSPEQVLGSVGLDLRLDIYALGLIIYESLTGVLPFNSDNLAKMFYSRIDEIPKLPSSINPAIPPALDAVISNAMLADRLSRFQTALDLKSALEAVR